MIGKKPCPFCGSDDVWLTIGHEGTMDADVVKSWIKCTNCLACGPIIFSSENDAKSRVTFTWNNRFEVKL